MALLPRYPIYIPSKGRYTLVHAPTFRTLDRDGVSYKVVVEPQDVERYAELVGEDRLLVLPKNDGQLHYARNWIKQHSIEQGAERHWQLDDNIIVFRRMYRGLKIPCDSRLALRVCEDFTDRYENVGVSGLNYQMFVTTDIPVPYFHNVHVYSCTLINNAMPLGWRTALNDDTDLCLQALSEGWCTLLLNAFMADKLRTMTRPGGNTDQLYGGDGRLKMAKTLERMWPGVVSVQRRWQRPQHVVASSWRKFDTPLKRRESIDFDALAPVDEYGMELRQVSDEITSPYVRSKLEEWRATH